MRRGAVRGINLYMIRHVRFDKKQRVIDELARRIETGQLGSGKILPGEHQLAEEFDVSRGTLREALSELKRRNYIATQAGVGSVVTYDGIALDQQAGWARALAGSGASIATEVLELCRVERPELTARFGHEAFVSVVRRRRGADGSLVSLERSVIPAVDGLENLPDSGLLFDSLTASLAACGYVGDHGDQWIGAEPLSDADALLLDRAPGSIFLKALRTTFDRDKRFMEQVESLLDPVHFRLHLNFGDAQ